MPGSPSGISSAILKIEALNTGYSQGSGPSGRWSFVRDRSARPLVLVANRNADCSAAVGASVVLAGYSLALPSNFYTGNMRPLLVQAGAKDLPFTRNVRLGDILWRPGHTEVVTGVNPPMMTGARLDENGQIVGGKPGDQTGREFATSALSSNWTRILRFPTTPPPQPAVKPAATTETQPDSEENEMRGCYYNDGKTRTYMLFNEVSGFVSEFSAGTDRGPMAGSYVNPIATNWRTGSWPEITKSHATRLKADLALVRGTK